MITEIFALAVIMMIIAYLRSQNRSKRHPPGPTGIPILGSIPFLGSNPYKTMAKWGQIYGDIFTMNMGPMSVVVMNKSEHIREASKKMELSGRPKIGLGMLWAGCGTDTFHGIAFNEGDDWQEQRRFALRQLRDIGFGKSSMEDLILNEVQELLTVLKDKCGKPFEVEHLFEMAVVNALWTLVSGRRFESNDQRLQQLARDMMTVADVSSAGLAVFFPKLARMFPDLLGWNKLVKAIGNIRSLAKDEVKSHKKDFNPDSPRDLIDIYLKEIQNTTNSSSSFYQKKGEMSLVVLLMDLFGGGVETTSTALTWGCLLLATHPHIQAKLQDEVDRAIGKDKLPTLADREKMPYVDATLHEILRFSSLIPLLVFHSVMIDTEFHGYILPKGSAIAFNAYSAMHDPNNFDNPDEFRPERFLNPSGTFKSNEHFLAFGTGKRVCLGESLAKIEGFLFLASLAQNFNMTLPEDNIKPSLAFKNPGMILHPKPYQLILSERKASVITNLAKVA